MIVKIAIDVPLYQNFDYRWNRLLLGCEPAIGHIVKIEFGRKITTGIVIRISDHTQAEIQPGLTLKEVLEVAPMNVIDPGLVRLCQFSAKYYLRPIGETLFASMPSDWKKPEKWATLEKQRQKKQAPHASVDDLSSTQWELNPDQSQALKVLKEMSALNRFEMILLKGITGSGKTAVYLEWLRSILAVEKNQCLIMVPEINLTPQLEKIIKAVFVNEEVVVLHSNITPAKRNVAWWRIQTGIARVIVGTRLSIFAPIPHLKAIVVDEEHDSSYKQQEGFRYHARDLAIWRAMDCKIPVVLTTATPSSETWQKAKELKIKAITLQNKAKQGATLANLHLIDLVKAAKNKQIDSIGLSLEIKEVIQTTWAKGKQTLVFINRRGYSPILHCKACSWKSECKKCSAWMVVHKKKRVGQEYTLQCHHCGTVTQPPKSCPECGNQDLATVGMGTQKIEEHLTELFPHIELLRIDSDSTKSKGRANDLFEKVHNGKPYLIIGTQMVSKGHDFQQIQSVIILDVDKSLYSQDFRAVEKVFSQLVQVSGRGGRSGQVAQAQVYIQTEFVEHTMFVALKNHHYDEYFTEILKERAEGKLPPYSIQALIIVESKWSEKNLQILQEIKRYLEEEKYPETHIYDPTPRTLHRLAGVERDQILIESTSRSEMQLALERTLDLIETLKKENRNLKIYIDRDPILY